MAIAQFVIVFCFVTIFVVFTVALCGIVWSCLKDAIIDWKQYQLKDRVITIQEYNELMDSLQEVKDSMWVLCDLLRAKGLLD